MIALTDAGSRATRRRLWLELLLIFVAAPGLVSTISSGHRWMVFITILLGCALCLFLLFRDEDFPRKTLWNAQGARRQLRPTLLRAAATLAIFFAALLVLRPAGMFVFPRQRPAVWLLVCALYPMASAFPQEIIYRTFFFHRYAKLFTHAWQRIAASALLFGWAHVMVHNLTAMLLATVGGVLFGYTFLRSRSALLAGLEHGLFGDFVFSTGLGGMFVNGVRFASAVIR